VALVVVVEAVVVIVGMHLVFVAVLVDMDEVVRLKKLGVA
jgi:hypothetical protein